MELSSEIDIKKKKTGNTTTLKLNMELVTSCGNRLYICWIECWLWINITTLSLLDHLPQKRSDDQTNFGMRPEKAIAIIHKGKYNCTVCNGLVSFNLSSGSNHFGWVLVECWLATGGIWWYHGQCNIHKRTGHCTVLQFHLLLCSGSNHFSWVLVERWLATGWIWRYHSQCNIIIRGQKIAWVCSFIFCYICSGSNHFGWALVERWLATGGIWQYHDQCNIIIRGQEIAWVCSFIFCYALAQITLAEYWLNVD